MNETSKLSELHLKEKNIEQQSTQSGLRRTQDAEVDGYDTEFIGNHGICYRGCDIYPVPMVSDTYQINIHQYMRIRDGDIVYVITSALAMWMNQVYPILKKNKKRVILVTGDSDKSAPLGLFKGASGDIEIQKALFHQIMGEGVILHWFCQNCDYPETNMVTPIPIGIDYHSLNRREYWGEPQTTWEEQDKQLMEIRKSAPKWEERSSKILLDAHLTANTNPTDRGLAYIAIGDKEYKECLPKGLKRSDYWRKLTEHKYILSPF